MKDIYGDRADLCLPEMFMLIRDIYADLIGGVEVGAGNVA